jgi:predicted kinase
MKVLILQGLPASGKSTIAKQLVEEGYVRTNKDELRAMMYGSAFSKRSEKMVCAIRDKIINTALKAGGDVVIDDTNFNPKHVAQIKNIARNYGAEVEVRLIDTPVEVCIERNAKRENPIPEVAIYGMHKQYLRGEK